MNELKFALEKAKATAQSDLDAGGRRQHLEPIIQTLKELLQFHDEQTEKAAALSPANSVAKPAAKHKSRPLALAQPNDE